MGMFGLAIATYRKSQLMGIAQCAFLLAKNSKAFCHCSQKNIRLSATVSKKLYFYK